MAKRHGGPTEQDNDSAPPARRRGGDPLGIATLVGVAAVLAVSLASWQDVGRVDRSLSDRLGKLETRLAQVADRIDKLPAQAASARQGPDPNRVYPVKTDGAPVQGLAGAPVTIAEFSDFQ